MLAVLKARRARRVAQTATFRELAARDREKPEVAQSDVITDNHNHTKETIVALGHIVPFHQSQLVTISSAIRSRATLSSSLNP